MVRNGTKAFLLGILLAGTSLAAGQSLSSGTSDGSVAEIALPGDSAPRAVKIARTTTVPGCTSFVDAASADGDGTAQKPHTTLATAVAAASAGSVICVAEGVYAEELSPGTKYFTLAGGFQRGKDFKVRDSATYITRAEGRGGSFIRIVDPGPTQGQLTAIDGFEISGYSQAIYRAFYQSQRFDITNNFIHDNSCADPSLAGAGFALDNISGTIRGNVFANNSCGRGGAGFINDGTNSNAVSIENNRIEGNAGTQPDSAHGGALYLFGNRLAVTGNEFTNNTVTQWGGGLYIGAFPEGNQPTTATLAWNVFRGNRAGNGGGGFFCDDGATCLSDHDIYDGNCGGNILLDAGSGPTVAVFDHMTNYGALEAGCGAPGTGVRIDKPASTTPDRYSFTNSIFWGNAQGLDFSAVCDAGCNRIKVDVTYSMVQTEYLEVGMNIAFGAGNIAPADPLFADRQAGDFHLRSAAGRWTPAGQVKDAATSPAIGKGDPDDAADQNPEHAGKRSELGAYGNSGEASHVE